MRIGAFKLFEKTVVGKDDPLGPLLVRYQIIRHPKFWGIFLHKLCRSDHDRALHDHPWPFVSIVLWGGYKEIRHVRDINNVVRYETIEETEFQVHRPGAILYRPATWRHRVIIEPGRPAWTLILVGPRARRWGFWPNDGWCYWRKYNTHKGICEETEIHAADDGL